jgi:hypothetical protein
VVTVAVAADAEMVVHSEVNSRGIEIVLHATVMVEIVVTEVLEEIVMVEEIAEHAVNLEVEKIVHVAKEVSTEIELRAEMVEVVLVEVVQDRSVNRSTKNKFIKHFV